MRDNVGNMNLSIQVGGNKCIRSGSRVGLSGWRNEMLYGIKRYYRLVGNEICNGKR